MGVALIRFASDRFGLPGEIVTVCVMGFVDLWDNSNLSVLGNPGQEVSPAPPASAHRCCVIVAGKHVKIHKEAALVAEDKEWSAAAVADNWSYTDEPLQSDPI